MRWVVVEPGGERFSSNADDSVIEAAWRAGLSWPTTCWGQADCGACAMEIVDGRELLSAVGELEAARLADLPRRQAGRRLACQARVVGEGTVTVRKPGVRPR